MEVDSTLMLPQKREPRQMYATKNTDFGQKNVLKRHRRCTYAFRREPLRRNNVGMCYKPISLFISNLFRPFDELPSRRDPPGFAHCRDRGHVVLDPLIDQKEPLRPSKQKVGKIVGQPPKMHTRKQTEAARDLKHRIR